MVVFYDLVEVLESFAPYEQHVVHGLQLHVEVAVLRLRFQRNRIIARLKHRHINIVKK